jgi:hypothetical protein
MTPGRIAELRKRLEYFARVWPGDAATICNRPVASQRELAELLTLAESAAKLRELLSERHTMARGPIRPIDEDEAEQLSDAAFAAALPTIRENLELNRCPIELARLIYRCGFMAGGHAASLRAAALRSDEL